MIGRSERVAFLLLYARSRYLPYILPAIVILLGLATWWSYSAAAGIRNEVDRAVIQRNLISSITVLAAVSITFVVGSPWGEMDNAAGLKLQRLRVWVLIASMLVVLLLMTAMGFMWETDHASWMLARNLLGWIGITLIASQLLGENQARLISIAWAGIALVSGDSWRVHFPPWAWPMQGAGDRVSWVIALTALSVGMWLLIRSRFETTSD